MTADRAQFPVTLIRTREDIRAALTAEVDARIEEEVVANRIAVAAELIILATGYGNTIQCIKVIRAAFGLGLKEAKDAHDAARMRLDPNWPF